MEKVLNPNLEQGDVLSAEALAVFARNTIFAGNIHHWPEVESTNSLALEAAASAKKSTEGAVFLADAQTAGRGRGQHTWHSERGNGLYASFLVRPKIPPAHILWLSLSAALAVQDAVRGATELNADIRWPNDLLFGEKKFCGILTEASSDPAHVQYAVIGIGINVNHAEFPSELSGIATSLRMELGRSISRVHLAGLLVRELDREYRMLLQAAHTADHTGRQFAPIINKISAGSSYVMGKKVHVEENGGYSGITDGLDFRGFLRVRTDDGLRTVISGSVRPLAKEI